MSNLRTFCLVLFLLFSLFHYLSCASSEKEPGWCKALFQCGKITAGFPFWGGNRPEVCGHPLLQLRCYKNKYTSLIISNQLYSVHHIDQRSNTLRLARLELQDSFCKSTFTAETLPPEIFELSPNYKSLTVFYLCNRTIPYSSSNTCPDRGLVSVSQDLDYREFCGDSFTINVPKGYIPEEKVLNLTNLENTLKEGFEVKVKIDEKACQECTSSHGICSFKNNTQVCCKENSSSRCNTLYPPAVDEYHLICGRPFSCADQKDLFYPFWVPGREACGHPDFKLNCSGQFAELNISSIRYRVLSMSYDSPVIRLARSDDMNNLCPSVSPNALFNQTVLPLVSGTDLVTLYYDCNYSSLPDRSSYNLGEFPCGDEKDDARRYYLTANPPPSSLNGGSGLLDIFKTNCGKNVSIPVSKQALDEVKTNPSPENLEKVLDQDFELGLNNDCTECIKSRGACGYNRDKKSFNCYCVDHPHSRTCGDKGLSTGALAGIGTASGLVGIFLIAAVVFGLISRRRKTQAAQYTSKDLPVTSSYSSKETSSFPTSTTIYSSNHSLVPSISSLANGSVYFGVQVFSYEELEEATENFSRELGDGGFGTVYYGVLKDGRAVAVKRLYERSLKRVEQFKNEIEILKSLKHRNLVILYGCTSRHSRELLLVYEFISNGTLADHLHGDRAESRPLCWSVRLNVAIETASALSFLHQEGIIHRDVKTTNILLDEDYTVKVADFGLSRLFPMDQTHISTAPQGTPGYVDPEYYQCYRLNEKSDVYSFGVVLVELISSKEAVDITRHRHDINLANMALSKIQNNALDELVDPSMGFEKDPEVKREMMSVAELAFRCLQQEREVRPSMDEIVEILLGIKGQSPGSQDVVDIGDDDVGLLKNSIPPPISPETDKWGSSDTATSSF